MLTPIPCEEGKPVSNRHETAGTPPGRPDPRFAVDCMLGTLAKWLKILGYDALYLRVVDDADLVERARADGRILLTRDRKMTERRRASPFILIQSERSIDQLREVVASLGLDLDEERLLTRCLPCNAPTLEAASDEIRDLVPPYVFRTQRRFRRCPACGRVYWGATHRDKMVERLREVFR